MDETNTMPAALLGLPRVVVVCGHYGVGKTNFSLNLAYDLAQAGRTVTLVDLDIVNPYFRSSDHAAALERAGIELLCPQSAGTALDAPMLSVAIDAAIQSAQAGQESVCIIDAGGDDAGMVALGRFAHIIAAEPYAMLYVVNAMRELTKDPKDAAALLPEMEAASHLQATHVVNNTHLMHDTTPDILKRGQAFARDVASLLHLPLLCTAVPCWDTPTGTDAQATDAPASSAPATDAPRACAAGLGQMVDSGAVGCDAVYFVRIYVKKPWDV